VTQPDDNAAREEAGMPALVRSMALCAAFLTGLASVAGAQPAVKYPDKPVRFVLPYGPGGVADVTTRLIAQKLSESMGQNFVIENKPGAGGILAGKAVLSAPADGYTLFLSGNASAINESLFKAKPFNVLTDFTPVATLAEFEMLLATKGDSPLGTIGKLVEYANAHPGKLNFGTINLGSTQNLSAELFRMVTGVNVQLVTYRTTPELVTAVIRGDVDVAFDYLAAFNPTITSNQMKVIATSGDHPNPQLPGVPIVKDSGYPAYVVTSWNALSAPTGTPPEIIAKLSQAIQAVLKLPDVKARMAGLGMEPMAGTPEQLAERMRRDIEKWRAVIDKAGIPKQ
jgi:tripartite-type tricarboxylate transporter receptor subunit TctC